MNNDHHKLTPTMCLPLAAEFHADPKTLYQLRDATIGEQPETSPTFHFGLQPIGTKDVDANLDGRGKRRKVLIIGAGDVYKKFARHALDQRGTERIILDMNPDIDKPEKGGIKFNALEHRGRNLETVLAENPDIDYAMVLTPPGSHSDSIRELTRRGVPVMVEKPLVPAGFYLDQPGGLDKRLKYGEKTKKAPVYCMDWEVLLATPLMAALDIKSPFQKIVEFGSPADHNAFKKFDMSHIARVEATFLENSNGLGSIGDVKKNRPWMFNIMAGGGILYDMAVHPMNTLAAMGFKPGEVKSAMMGEWEDDYRNAHKLTDGHYKRIGNNDDAAEFYARAEMVSHYNGQSIPTLIEAGKGGLANDMRITLVDNGGNVINWEYGKDKSEVTLRDKTGKTLATACSHVDPYALMLEQATCFFDQEKAASGKEDHLPTGLYYAEHKDVLLALDQMHQVGRAQAVGDGEIVKQLKLEPANSVNLAIADVKPPIRALAAG